MTFEVQASITLFSPENGGRKTPLSPPKFGCLLWFGQEPYHDIRLFLDADVAWEPGKTFENVPMDFLDRELVEPYLYVGKKFILRENKNIGEGVISKVNISLKRT